MTRTWNGLTARYTEQEDAVMTALRAGLDRGEVHLRELEVIHELKSLLGARIV